MMVEIDFKIVITAIISLTIIYLALIISGKNTETIGTLIVGIIAMSIGVFIPTPKIDNKSGVLRW